MYVFYAKLTRFFNYELNCFLADHSFIRVLVYTDTMSGNFSTGHVQAYSAHLSSVSAASGGGGVLPSPQKTFASRAPPSPPPSRAQLGESWARVETTGIGGVSLWISSLSLRLCFLSPRKPYLIVKLGPRGMYHEVTILFVRPISRAA